MIDPYISDMCYQHDRFKDFNQRIKFELQRYTHSARVWMHTQEYTVVPLEDSEKFNSSFDASERTHNAILIIFKYGLLPTQINSWVIRNPHEVTAKVGFLRAKHFEFRKPRITDKQFGWG